MATDVVMVAVDKTLVDSRPLSSDAIRGDGVDGGVSIIKEDPDNDADEEEDDQKDDDDDGESNDATATDVSIAINEDGDGDDGTSVDCASVPVCESKCL